MLQAVESEPVTQRAPKVWLLEDLEGKSGELPVNFQAAEKYPAGRRDIWRRPGGVLCCALALGGNGSSRTAFDLYAASFDI